MVGRNLIAYIPPFLLFCLLPHIDSVYSEKEKAMRDEERNKTTVLK